VTSVVSICNLALSHIGDAANVSDLEEGSVQADHCARFYPIARDELFELHPWSFAKRRAVLALLSDPPESNWLFAYALPAGCIKVRAVLAEGAADKEQSVFDIEADDDGNRVLFTDVEDARVIYTKRITDTARFSPLFVSALSRLLASYLAGPIVKGSEGVAMGKDQYGVFSTVFSAAKAADNSNSLMIQGETPSSIAARSVGVNSAWLADGRILR
jgi:hypothetical protein